MWRVASRSIAHAERGKRERGPGSIVSGLCHIRIPLPKELKCRFLGYCARHAYAPTLHRRSALADLPRETPWVRAKSVVGLVARCPRTVRPHRSRLMAGVGRQPHRAALAHPAEA